MAQKHRSRPFPHSRPVDRRHAARRRECSREPIPAGIADALTAACGVAVQPGAPLSKSAAEAVAGQLAGSCVARCVLSLLTDPAGVCRDIARSEGAALTFAALLEDLDEGAALHAAALRLVEQARAWIADEIARRPDGAQILAAGPAERVVNSRGEPL